MTNGTKLATKEDLMQAALDCFQAARRVAAARSEVETAAVELRSAQSAHAAAAERQRLIEDDLVRQERSAQLRVIP